MNQELNPWYITGFIENKGSFLLHLNTEKKKRKKGFTSIYTYWLSAFTIELKEDGLDILNALKDYFDCGTITVYQPKTTKKDTPKTATYHVRKRQDLMDKIIPHFDEYPLHTSKQQIYNLWREGVEILHQADKKRKSKFSPFPLSEEESNRLNQIKLYMVEHMSQAKKDRSLQVLLRKKLGKTKKAPQLDLPI